MLIWRHSSGLVGARGIIGSLFYALNWVIWTWLEVLLQMRDRSYLSLGVGNVSHRHGLGNQAAVTPAVSASASNGTASVHTRSTSPYLATCATVQVCSVQPIRFIPLKFYRLQIAVYTTVPDPLPFLGRKSSTYSVFIGTCKLVLSGALTVPSLVPRPRERANPSVAVCNDPYVHRNVNEGSSQLGVHVHL